jgi:hypothetical protein
MIELSVTDLLLFAWAALATAYAFKYREEAHMSKYVIHKILSDKNLRDEMTAGYEQAQQEMKA